MFQGPTSDGAMLVDKQQMVNGIPVAPYQPINNGHQVATGQVAGDSAKSALALSAQKVAGAGARFDEDDPGAESVDLLALSGERWGAQ